MLKVMEKVYHSNWMWCVSNFPFFPSLPPVSPQVFYAVFFLGIGDLFSLLRSLALIQLIWQFVTKRIRCVTFILFFFLFFLSFSSTSIFITNIKFPIQQMLQHARLRKYFQSRIFLCFSFHLFSLHMMIPNTGKWFVCLIKLIDSRECMALQSRKMLKSSVSLTQIHRKSTSNGHSITRQRALMLPPVMFHVTVSNKIPFVLMKFLPITAFDGKFSNSTCKAPSPWSTLMAVMETCLQKVL